MEDAIDEMSEKQEEADICLEMSARVKEVGDRVIDSSSPFLRASIGAGKIVYTSLADDLKMISETPSSRACSTGSLQQ